MLEFIKKKKAKQKPTDNLRTGCAIWTQLAAMGSKLKFGPKSYIIIPAHVLKL